MEFDCATGRSRDLAPDWKLSPSHWSFGPDGTLFLETEDHARTALFALSGSGTPKRLIHDGTISSVRAGRDRLFFQKQSMSAPAEVFSAGFDGANVTRVTRFTEPVVSAVTWGEVREMTLEGAYGETIQMFVVLPPDYETGKKYPLLKVVHGGPHATSGDTFQYRWNPPVSY